MKIARTTLVAATALFATIPFEAQSKSERRAGRVAESAEPRFIAGGSVSFEVNMAADKAFDAVVKYFQTHEVLLDESSKKDLGQLVTSLRIVDVGGFINNNKGFRTYITFIRESESSTTIKVKVTEQERSNHMQADPWSDPVISDSKTAMTAAQLKFTLKIPLTPNETALIAMGGKAEGDGGGSADGPEGSVWTDKKVYKPADIIIVHYKDFPESGNAWIDISRAKDAAGVYRKFDWTKGKVEGEMTFSKLKLDPGTYEVRVHFTRDNKVDRRFRFQVE